MKFRITRKTILYQKRPFGRYKAMKIRPHLPISMQVPVRSETIDERIDVRRLFEISALPEPKRTPHKKRNLRSSARAVKGFFVSLHTRLARFAEIILKRRAQKQRTPAAFFFGMLLAAISVSVLCAAAALAHMFSAYLLPYRTLVIPSLIEKNVNDLESELDGDIMLYKKYQYSDTVPSDTVISQEPSPNVTRKIYSGNVCTITVTVSTGKKYRLIPDISGLSRRDAVLLLMNEGIAFKIQNEYSGTVPAGEVISTVPQKDQALYHDQALTLRVSLGRKVAIVSVPNLCGTSEQAAKDILASTKLVLGQVTYRVSKESPGKVIEQQYPPYSSLEEGSSVDICISLGSATTQKSVPNLYGMTPEQARDVLREFGLVTGSVFLVSSGAAHGKIIAQSPMSGTPITSSITSVDIYVSS